MISYKKKFFIIYFIVFFLFLLGTNFIFALEINYPPLPQSKEYITPGETIAEYVRYIFNLFFWIGIGLASATMVIGGTRYIFFSISAQGKASARNQISSAFFGLLILISSVLLLKTINPEIVSLRVSEIKKIIIPEPSDISPPAVKKPNTLITVEIPFGTIIEKNIFETQTSPDTEKKPRMERIIDTVSNSLFTALKLKEQSGALSNLTLSGCLCKNTKPDGSYCTCDPCKNVRENIQAIEIDNLKLIGIKDPDGIVDNDSPSDSNIINLISEQKKTVKEIRLLKEELNKLIRSEMFMLEEQNSLWSLSDYEKNRDYFKANEWTLVYIKFWEEIPIDINDDYATFYAMVSGNIGTEVSEEIISPEEYENIEIPDQRLEQAVCKEVPVGKIIDRAKKITEKLIKQLEELINLSKQMANDVDYLHFLISQCSSQRCSPFSDNGGEDDGDDTECPDCGDITNSNVNNRARAVLIAQAKECKGNPCPEQEIKSQIKKINEIFEEIEKLIKNPMPDKKDEKENIGIMPLIETVVKGLLKDLKNEIKEPMADCVTDISLEISTQEETRQPNTYLISCESALRWLLEGKTIQQCHFLLKEEGQKAFKECLSECYLEKTHQKHKECLTICLSEKTELNPEELRTWYHSFDFFCCAT